MLCSSFMNNTKVFTLFMLALLPFILSIWGLSSLEIPTQKQQRCLINSFIIYWDNAYLQIAYYKKCIRSVRLLK